MADRSGAGSLTAAPLHSGLHEALAGFDGKATTLLGEAQAIHGETPGYLDALIALSGDEAWQVSSGATWLLYHHLEKGGQLTADQAAGLVAALPRLSHWSALLHVCQCIRHLHLDGSDAQKTAEWLEPLLGHTRPFIRAWALDAMVSLARDTDALAPSAEAALAAAVNDEAASVRARARKLDPHLPD